MARKLKWFARVETLEALKQEYKRLCKLHHPDINPAGEKAMMEINAEYDYIVDNGLLRHGVDASAPERTRTTADRAATSEAMRAYRDIIARLVVLEGLDIELCGAWLWISGNTYPHKAALKAAGCMWASKKSMWYWRPAELAERTSRRTMPMEYIRDTYGSIAIEGQPQRKIAASA